MTTVRIRQTELTEPATAPAPESVAHEHDPHLAHQFDTPTQQYEAAKLGMWLFLATEVLLFGGLFCLYGVLRRTHREIIEYGSQFLDTRWGLINTAVLITSSMTMAIAVTAAQRGRYRLLVSMLLCTVLGGCMFMAVKYVEYHHKFHEGLVWGAAFYDPPEWAVRAERDRLARIAAEAPGGMALTAEDVVASHVANVDHGLVVWQSTCRSCHGAAGEGIAGQGKDLRGSEYVRDRGDVEMLAFIKAGRPADDPLNTTGVAMLPKGGNPLLSDADLLDVIALVRTFEAVPGADEPEAGTDLPPPDAPDAAPDAAAALDAQWIPASSIPEAPPGPPGLTAAARGATEADPVAAYTPHHVFDPDRPPNAHLFFGLYFGMTGLHGLHVLAGIAVISWITFRAIRGEFGPAYYTPVDLTGLYWHIVDIIWIFLFPLLYLIG